ncbi:hypothetical protein CPJCM30710_31930 [Clostridium polyendosporum]|uniref:Uncharacterized protein n=1 Tax=Clostridium polyendosporum TaxID=69208 RepID=A0A919VHR7_9CLOT|nr:hypothetical protein [Clostridium polyendosporum]GIM30527.1 hypothetical protein CPJCM30710_31930 [Clostridium polyendosporum]
MKKLINILSLLSGLVTCIAVILTLLTTYHFIYGNKIFNSYNPIQIGLAVTMILWGIKFFFYENGERRVAYSIICMIIAIGSLFFLTMYVK